MTNASVRKDLEQVASLSGPIDNAGLVFDRYLNPHHSDASPLGTLPERAVIPVAYQSAFHRWKTSHEQRPHSRMFTALAASPIAIGLGGSSPVEVGFTFMNPYGVPVIPGSALKGMSRRVAAKMQDQLGEAGMKFLFGDPGAQGKIIFWDAWYASVSDEGRPLRSDVITVHHPAYYRRETNQWPTDFDDPNPVSFLTVREGARFLFVIDAPGDEWADFVVDALKWGLEHEGIGAKTNAGYGFFNEFADVVVETEETWRQCRFKRTHHRGVVKVIIESRIGEGRLEVDQSSWQPIEESMGPVQREELKEGRFEAAVRVKRSGQTVTFLGLVDGDE